MSGSPRNQIPKGKGGIRNPKYRHPAAPQPNRPDTPTQSRAQNQPITPKSGTNSIVSPTPTPADQPTGRPDRASYATRATDQPDAHDGNGEDARAREGRRRTRTCCHGARRVAPGSARSGGRAGRGFPLAPRLLRPSARGKRRGVQPSEPPSRRTGRAN